MERTRFDEPAIAGMKSPGHSLEFSPTNSSVADGSAWPRSIISDKGAELTSYAILIRSVESLRRLALHRSGQARAECLHRKLNRRLLIPATYCRNEPKAPPDGSSRWAVAPTVHGGNPVAILWMKAAATSTRRALQRPLVKEI